MKISHLLTILSLASVPVATTLATTASGPVGQQVAGTGDILINTTALFGVVLSITGTLATVIYAMWRIIQTGHERETAAKDQSINRLTSLSETLQSSITQKDAFAITTLVDTIGKANETLRSVSSLVEQASATMTNLSEHNNDEHEKMQNALDIIVHNLKMNAHAINTTSRRVRRANADDTDSNG